MQARWQSTWPTAARCPIRSKFGPRALLMSLAWKPAGRESSWSRTPVLCDDFHNIGLRQEGDDDSISIPKVGSRLGGHHRPGRKSNLPGLDSLGGTQPAEPAAYPPRYP